MKNTHVSLRNNHGKALAAFIILAVILRIAAAVLIGDIIPKYPGIYDEVSYHTLAAQIIDGHGYSFPESWYPFTKAGSPTSHWSFLYPLFLAGIYKIFGIHPLAARVVQSIICGTFFSLLIFLITRRLVNEKIALVSAGLTAVYGYYIYYNAALMTESLFIIAVLSIIYLCLLLLERSTIQRWMLLGVAAGLAILLRQTALFLTILLVGWLFIEYARKPDVGLRLWQPAVALLIIIGMLVPWTIRNYARYGTFLLLNSNSGYALFASTHPDLGTVWPASVDNVVVPIPEEFAAYNEAQLDKGLSGLALQNVLADPMRIVLLSLSKSLEYFKFWPLAQSSLLSNAVRVLSFGLYLPFMIAGLVLSFKNWRRFMPLYLLCICFAGLHILSWPAPRYRLPSDAAMMTFAGMAVYALLKTLFARKVAFKEFFQEGRE